MRFVKTISFSTNNRFDSDKDDPRVNQALRQIQQAGAQILDFKVLLAGGEVGATALYVIEYDAPDPI